MSYRGGPPIPCPVGACDARVPALFHSSCVPRAAWTPLERARFDREDAEDERLEMQQGRTPYTPLDTAQDDELDQVRGAPARRPVSSADVAEAVLARRRVA